MNRYILYLLLLVCWQQPTNSASAQATSNYDQTRRIKLAIDQHREFSQLGVGVKVLTDGTALIWGDEAPAETMKKLEEYLKTFPGIVNVVSECDLSKNHDPLLVRVNDAMNRPARSEPARDSVANDTNRPAPPGATVSRAPGLALAEPRAEREPPAPAPSTPRVMAAKAAPIDDRHHEQPREGRAPSTVLLEPSTPNASLGDLVERIQHRLPQYRDIAFRIEGQKIVLLAKESQSAQAWALAKEILNLTDHPVFVKNLGK